MVRHDSTLIEALLVHTPDDCGMAVSSIVDPHRIFLESHVVQRFDHGKLYGR